MPAYIVLEQSIWTSENIKNCLQIYIRNVGLSLTRENSNSQRSCKYSINEEKYAIRKHGKEASKRKNVIYSY